MTVHSHPSNVFLLPNLSPPFPSRRDSLGAADILAPGVVSCRCLATSLASSQISESAAFKSAKLLICNHAALVRYTMSLAIAVWRAWPKRIDALVVARCLTTPGTVVVAVRRGQRSEREEPKQGGHHLQGVRSLHREERKLENVEEFEYVEGVE